MYGNEVDMKEVTVRRNMMLCSLVEIYQLWYVDKFVPDYWCDISEDSNFCIHHVENQRSH
jgi:hypothetical protein